MNRPVGVDVDAHVHIYDAFDRVRLVGAAASRARARGRRAVLALTEARGDRAFEELRAGERCSGLHVTATEDVEALAVQVDGGPPEPVYVVAGRQLVSSERVEVLALGLTDDRAPAHTPDGELPAERLVEAVLEAGALCVLPWSVGKWIGARGRLVEQLVERPAFAKHRRFFLGDIAARSWPWPEPAVFDRSVRVLRGTDPLPLPGEERGVARYGCALDGHFAPDRPWRSVRGMLESADRVEVSGRRDGFIGAFVDQIRVRMDRRSRAGRGRNDAS